MGFKTFIRNWLNVDKSSPGNNYENCVCDKSVIFTRESLVECFNNGKESIKIGPNTYVNGHLQTQINSGGKIVIGKICFIGKNSSIRAAQMVEIGDYVLIAHNTTILDNNSHPINPIQRRAGSGSEEFDVKQLNPKSIKICNDAWIGCNSVILKGVTIGEAAIVGAGSVVTHDVEPWTIVAGNPAKVIKRIEH